MTWRNNILASFIFFTFLSVANAQVFINEIMFNPKGSDSGREWVEICATESFELTDALSFKDKSGSKDVLHSLSLSQGDGSLLKDECAIIASDAAKLKSDFPSLSANLLDATPNFSLLNSGESIAILKDGALLDQVLYDTQNVSEGQSLHRNAQSFVPADPTPWNKDFSANAVLESADTNDTESEQIRVRNITELPLYKFKVVELEPPQDIFLRVPDKLSVHSHELLELPVEIFDARGKVIGDAKVTISWGDFSDKEFKKQSEVFSHIYKQAGDYIILIKATKQNLSDEKTIAVKVQEPKLELYFDKDKDILIFDNKSDFKINLLNWKLKAGRSLHLLPETLIAADSKLKVSGNTFISGLYHKREIKLISPDAKFEIYAKEQSKDAEKKNSVHDDLSEKKETAPLSTAALNDKSLELKNDNLTAQASNAALAQRTKRRAQNTSGAEESIFGYSVALVNVGLEKTAEKSKGNSVSDKKESIEYELSKSDPADIKDDTEQYSFKSEFNFYFVFFALSLGLFALLVYLFYLFKFDEFDDWTFEE